MSNNVPCAEVESINSVVFILNNCHTGWTLNFLSLGVNCRILNEVDRKTIQARYSECYLKNKTKKSYKIFIFQNWRYDFLIILRFLAARFFKKKNANLWILFHGRSERQTDSLHRAFVKSSYIKVLEWISAFFGGRCLYISNYVAESYEADGVVLPQIIDSEVFSPKIDARVDRILVVGNHLARSHFDIGLLYIYPPSRYLIVGFNNDQFAKEGFEVLSANSPEQLATIFNSCKFYLSVVKPPEHWYNLGTLEAMACGLYLLCSSAELERIPDSVEKYDIKNVNELIDKPSISEVNRRYVCEMYSKRGALNVLKREIARIK